MKFFDSNGDLWEVCPPTAPRAEAFGPEYTARRVKPEKAGLSPRDGETAYAAAARLGLVVEDETWGAGFLEES